MKRLLATALAAITSIALLASCGNNQKNDKPDQSSEAESSAAVSSEAESSESGSKSQGNKSDAKTYKDGLGDVKADKKYKIGFSIFMRDQFLSQVESAFASECDRLGIEQVTADANNNANDQLNHIRNFASQNMDAIVVNLVSTDNTDKILEAAGDTPVVFVNRQPDGELKQGQQTYVGSDEYIAGKLQGEFLVNYFKNSGKDVIKYVLMQGTLGLQNTQARTEAAVEELEKSGLNFECVYQDTAEWDRAKAQNKMQTFLGTSTEFDAVICNADEMALGCIEAMKSANIDLHKIPVVGIDGLVGGATSVKNGEMAFTVHQNAFGQGAGAARAAVLLANGDKDIPTFVEIPFEPVSPETVDNYL